MTPTVFISIIAILVSIVVIIHLFVTVRDRQRLRERNNIELSKQLLRKYNIRLDEDHCEECEDFCVLYRAYLEIKEEDK